MLIALIRKRKGRRVHTLKLNKKGGWETLPVANERTPNLVACT